MPVALQLPRLRSPRPATRDAALNHPVASFSAAMGIAMLMGAGVAWHEYLGAPPTELLELPADLIPLDSDAGQALLAGSEAIADYEQLQANFVAQSRKAYCGVASAVMALNAAGATPVPLDQRSIFAHPSVDIHPLKVSFLGMSLREFGELLRAHEAEVSVVHASSTDVDAFRRTLRANLGRTGDYLLINYGREHIGQARSGHISPIAAYHAPSDRLLILDVAAYRYPPVWVRVQDAWDAMNAPLNPETTITRGFVIVHGTALARDDAAVAESAPANPH